MCLIFLPFNSPFLHVPVSLHTLVITTGFDVVLANDPEGIPVLNWVADMTRELARAEDAVFGPGAAPAITTMPPNAVSR